MKLKKCPFCGGEARLEKTVDIVFPTQYFIHCPDCNTEAGLFESKTRAILAWNRRPPEDELAGALRRLIEFDENGEENNQDDYHLVITLATKALANLEGK